ncbi:MAG: sensor histidine kinase [Clostridia bacterium]|nr:sensor histidine kinase [Clostridia bacterium]
MSILKYIRQRRRSLLLLLLCSMVFVATFALYRLPVLAALYPAGLCLLILIVFGIVDYIRLRRKHLTLLALRQLPAVLTERLSMSESAVETEYQQLLTLLHEEQRRLTGIQHRRYQDMMDYYTVWAHQIKTPIAAMRLHLQQEDSPLSRTLMSELMRVEQYADMVLTYLRLDTDSTDYVIREYDVDSIVRQAVKRFAGEFIARKLMLDYQPLNATVITDEKWLLFVVEQVLSNALKYTHTGGVTICMEAPKTLCIRDTGMGIAPEDLPRIFEQGFTGHLGRDDKKASGIGLYLCKRICQNLGHGISAESAPGKGTTIRIDLYQRGLTVE